MSNKIKVGILSIQGSVIEHMGILKKLKVPFRLVRSKEDLKDLTHLIIPGGESTTLVKLLQEYKIWDQLKERCDPPSPRLRRAQGQLKIFGTCAGAILLEGLGMNVKVKRNAYGSQLESFSANLTSKKFPNLRGVFIRAPKFIVSSKAKVLARYKKEPVLVKDKNFLATAFHPEISGDTRVHKFFLED